jgi:parallel beta-helix repeat protein
MLIKKLFFLSGALFLLLIYGCGQLQELEEVKDSKAMDGPTVFVDAGYSGEVSNGTQQFPFKDIQSAINAAKDGQTVFVNANSGDSFVYTSPVLIENKNIDLVGNGTGINVCLDSITDPKMKGLVIFKGPGACGSISGFEISHEDWYSGSGVICSDGAAPRIYSNIIFKHYNGIAVFSGAHPSIENNTFEGNKYGIRLEGTSSPVKAFISNNKIVRNKSYPGDVGAKAGIVLINHAEADIYNNIICENNDGISLSGSVCSANIYNNLIANNLRNGIKFDEIAPAAHRANVFNNIIYNHPNGAAILNDNPVSISAHCNSFKNNLANIPVPVDEIGTVTIAPVIIDTERYEISNKSAFQDLGKNDPGFNDKDGSRNDIGIYGGPYAL